MKWADNGGGDFEQPPTGTHIARCIRLIDIGTQAGEYQGKPTLQRQAVITWELPSTLMENGDAKGKPFIVSKFYTQSLGEKAALRKDLINWRGRDFTQEELAGFDAKNILGKACMLSITENEKKKAKITGLAAMPKGVPCPEQVNNSVFFSLDDFKQDIFDSLSKGIKAMIEESPEYKKLGKVDNEHFDQSFRNDEPDDIPF